MGRITNVIVIVIVAAAALELFVSVTGLVVAEEHRNEKIVTNDNYFPQAHMLINDARKSINVVMFQMRRYPYYGTSESNILIDDLIIAREQGIDVKVLIEGGEDYLGNDWREEQMEACKMLKENGVLVRADAQEKTTHAKFIVVDNSVLVGSTNWNYYSLTQNNEANVLISSEELADDFRDYFSALWAKGTEC